MSCSLSAAYSSSAPKAAWSRWAASKTAERRLSGRRSLGGPTDGPTRNRPRPSARSVEERGQLPAGPRQAVGGRRVRLHHALRRVLRRPPPAAPSAPARPSSALARPPSAPAYPPSTPARPPSAPARRTSHAPYVSMGSMLNSSNRQSQVSSARQIISARQSPYVIRLLHCPWARNLSPDNSLTHKLPLVRNRSANKRSCSSSRRQAARLDRGDGDGDMPVAARPRPAAWAVCL